MTTQPGPDHLIGGITLRRASTPYDCWVCGERTDIEVWLNGVTRHCCSVECYHRLPQAERDFQAWYQDGYSTGGYLSAMGYD